jgi:hypothetical protein
MSQHRRRATRAAALASTAVLAAGLSVAALTAPASAQQAPERSASCFDPHTVGAARGAARALDHREISAHEVRAVEARTKRVLDRKAAAAAAAAPNSKASIPVYVHEMRAAGGAGDVSAAQIQAQINVLNSTYAGADANEPAGVAAPNTGVRFVLAGSKEYFNNTWHADRSSTTYRSQTRQGGRNALNIWLVDFQYLGMATFPWDYARHPSVDGIRVQYNSLPRSASPAPGYRAIPHYDLGETATHEAGHWLGLYHTFQDGCVSTNDQVGLISSHRDVGIQRPLDQRGGSQIAEPFEVKQAVVDRSICHDKADAQAGHEHLRKGAHIDHLTARVQCLERRLGVTFITQVPHEIILKDRHVVSFRQHDQLPSACAAQ